MEAGDELADRHHSAACLKHIERQYIVALEEKLGHDAMISQKEIDDIVSQLDNYGSATKVGIYSRLTVEFDRRKKGQINSNFCEVFL